MTQYLEETALLDYSHLTIQKLINKNKWMHLDQKNKINQLYLFVRDQIPFGFNKADNIKASDILKDGYGQCNTKTILLMSLLRAVGIPCRFHGFSLDKKVQKGVWPAIVHGFSPKLIKHTWAEVYYNNEWQVLEGVILDKKYLKSVQNKFKHVREAFCGYAIATENLQNPEVDWNEKDTYIQKQGINQDLGIFDNPDNFYSEHQQDIGVFKKTMFAYLGRKLVNRNINNIRCAT